MQRQIPGSQLNAYRAQRRRPCPCYRMIRYCYMLTWLDNHVPASLGVGHDTWISTLDTIVKMYAIGDEYDIQGLKQAAVERFGRCSKIHASKIHGRPAPRTSNSCSRSISSTPRHLTLIAGYEIRLLSTAAISGSGFGIFQTLEIIYQRIRTSSTISLPSAAAAMHHLSRKKFACAQSA